MRDAFAAVQAGCTTLVQRELTSQGPHVEATYHAHAISVHLEHPRNLLSDVREAANASHPSDVKAETWIVVIFIIHTTCLHDISCAMTHEKMCARLECVSM